MEMVKLTFDAGEGRICEDGEQAVIVLDPVEMFVSSYVTNEGNPARPKEWDLRGCVILECPNDVDKSDVMRTLREREPELVELMGLKHDARFSEKAEAIESAIEELPRYWSAEAWLGDVAGDIEVDLDKAIASGADRAATLEAMAKRFAAEAKDDDALLDAYDVEQWLGEMWDTIKRERFDDLADEAV